MVTTAGAPPQTVEDALAALEPGPFGPGRDEEEDEDR